MKKIRIAVIAVLAMVFGLVATASAQYVSSPNAPAGGGDAWNGAHLGLRVHGEYIDQVEFEVPAVELTLDYGVLRQGATFRVLVPVTNNTKRPIVVSDGPTFVGVGSDLDINARGDLTIAAGATGNYYWDITVNTVTQAQLGTSRTISLALVARGVLPTIHDQWF